MNRGKNFSWKNSSSNITTNFRNDSRKDTPGEIFGRISWSIIQRAPKSTPWVISGLNTGNFSETFLRVNFRGIYIEISKEKLEEFPNDSLGEFLE